MNRSIAQLEALTRTLQQQLVQVRARVEGLLGGGWVREQTTVLVLTPAGGIPAMTGSGPWTPGEATCKVVRESATAGEIEETTRDLKVRNSVKGVSIAGDVVGQAKKIGRHWYIDVASCGEEY